MFVLRYQFVKAADNRARVLLNQKTVVVQRLKLAIAEFKQLFAALDLKL